MPPYEEDELISSWLDRVARFCGFSVDALLSENGLDPSKVDLAAIDIGLRCARFAPLANLLNTSVSALADRTIASAYPWATNFLARDWGVSFVRVNGVFAGSCVFLVLGATKIEQRLLVAASGVGFGMPHDLSPTRCAIDRRRGRGHCSWMGRFFPKSPLGPAGHVRWAADIDAFSVGSAAAKRRPD